MTLPGFAPLVLPIIERAISGASYGGKYTDDAIHEGLNVDDILFSKYSPGVLRFLAENFPQLGVEANISVFSLTSSSWFSINTGALTWERYGQVEKYQGAEELPEAFWPNLGPTPSAHKAGAKGECRRIRGTDGSLQVPGFENQQVRMPALVSGDEKGNLDVGDGNGDGNRVGDRFGDGDGDGAGTGGDG